MHVIIDSDVLVYAACYATEYETNTHPEFGAWRGIKDFKSFLKCQIDEDEHTEHLALLVKQTVTEPIKNTYKALDGMIERIMRNTDGTRYTIVVKGKIPNFRKAIPYIVEYKGNRRDRPSNFDSCVEYLHSFPSIVTAEGVEVDDTCATLLQTEEKGKACVATIDKDILYGVPGLKWDIKHEKWVDTTEKEALRFFYMQLLMGDPTDNIRGVDGLGPKKSEKLLPKGMKIEAMESVIQAEYQKEWNESWSSMLRMNKLLLWIQREKGQEPPMLNLYG